MPQRTVILLVIFQPFNECETNLVENRKDYHYAEIWMHIFRVQKIHSSVSQDILAYD